MASHAATSALRVFNVMKDVLRTNMVTAAHPTVDIPADTLKISLRAHQQAVIYQMEVMEQSLLNGMDCSGERLYSSYGILGDTVGAGKSLMVLGHIARLPHIKPLCHYTSMSLNSTSHVFSIKENQYTDISEAGSLIIVPHTLFRQWADYIKKQTNLKSIILDKKKGVNAENFVKSVFDSDIVLVSNTMYKEFSAWQQEYKIKWKRCFVDESDTIHMVSGYPRPEARFTWFITASWMNMIFPNETIYLHFSALQDLVFQANAPYAYLQPYFKDIYQAQRPYSYQRFSITSYNFFRDLLNTSHRLRGRMVIRCDDEFIAQSISLPVLHRTNIICRAPITQRIVSQSVSPEVQQLLHGGDIEGAMAALGVKTEDATSLIDAVTKNLQKELQRLKATHTFKSSLEYSTAQAKETALKSLEEKIQRTEESIKDIGERIGGYKDKCCPICYDDDIKEPLLTPCCSNVFCPKCILSCLSRRHDCPMCRASIQPNRLTKVVSNGTLTEVVNSSEVQNPEDLLEKKPEALLRLFKENPGGRFLVFSRYDNPFVTMEESIAGLGIRVKQLKGNKDAIASTLRAFQDGDLKCLLLNSHYAGSGLNITAATHVVLLHAMTHEEEKQILGRAYRMGRKEPLHFIRLLHSDEGTTAN
jgi:hypothetical protein